MGLLVIRLCVAALARIASGTADVVAYITQDNVPLCLHPKLSGTNSQVCRYLRWRIETGSDRP